MKFINTKGFTLVELMVVVAIIAILAAVGITVFSGLQKEARDGRRKSDIDAIATALEVKRGTATVYSSLTGSGFASGAAPVDSGNQNSGASSNTYCVYSRADNTAITGPATAWASGTCPIVTGATANSVSTSAVTVVASATNWTLCAALEKTTGTICKSSAQ